MREEEAHLQRDKVVGCPPCSRSTAHVRDKGQRVLQPEVQALARQGVHRVRRVTHQHHGAVLHAAGLHQLQRNGHGFTLDARH
jgi:hypothetical protein